MRKSTKKKILWVSVILAIIIVFGISITFSIKSTPETYFVSDSHGSTAKISISKVGIFTPVENAVTFPSTTYHPGDSVTFTDRYTVPSTVGTACVYAIDIRLYDPSTTQAWYKNIGCLANAYTTGQTISNSITYTIPNAQSSVGQWKAVSTYFYSAAGCNSCPGTAGQKSEDSTNSLTVAAQQTCTPNWVCGEWSICSGGNQVRTCSDANACGTGTNTNPVTQQCSGGGGNTPTCYDGIKNQDETGIDCGGAICNTCSNPGQTQHYYNINGVCTLHNEDSALGTAYDTADACNATISPPIDYTLYIILAIVVILIGVMAYVVYRRYRK